MDLLKLLNTDDTEVVNILIEESKAEIIDYCNLDQYDNKLNFILQKIVRYKFNKLGNEGIASQNNSSVSESYTNDYDASIYKDLNRHRRLKK